MCIPTTEFEFMISAMSTSSESNIPLPKFLKELTGNGIAVPKAMAVAGKIYKDYHTTLALSQLTDLKLKTAGIDDKGDRKLVLAALRKAGYVMGRQLVDSVGIKRKIDASEPGPSTPTTTPTKRRKIGTVAINEFLPNEPTDETTVHTSLDFNEVLDEEVIRTKSTVVNRAPLLAAWATVVAERMGFRREEALSIASVHTEMTAISKGVYLGVFEEGRKKEMEPARSSSQPYVDLMGRRPLYQTHSGEWRALLNNEPIQPSTAFAYISRAFRQTTPYIIGALRLLASSFSSQEINDKGWSLYADFRPNVEKWGGRGEVKYEDILAMKKGKNNGTDADSSSHAGFRAVDWLEDVVKYGQLERADHWESVDQQAEPKSKLRPLTLEEYEIALDDDHTFDDVDLNFPPAQT